ncbi:auxin-induced protein [Musa troglodytarum]|uniref:Auxin-induced protein n=1 Tax=Musa troglodytarum TaxID=320322 RepID=A0A9E7FYN7_9LILI|nr:auxin-induced protein [Musa troglodytarum]
MSIIKHAFESGITFFDTFNIYGLAETRVLHCDKMVPIKATARNLALDGIVTYGPIGCGFFAGKGVAESLPQNSYLVQPSSRTWMTMLSLLKVKLTSKDLKEISDTVPRDEVAGRTTYASVASFS